MKINVIVEFTKPVFGFDASGIEVGGGRLERQVHVVTLENYLHCYFSTLMVTTMNGSSLISCIINRRIMEDIISMLIVFKNTV